MTPREIIAKAWTITKRETHLRRWGYIGALFETLRSIELIAYQSYFLYWYFKGVSVGWLSVEVLFFEHLPLVLAIVITVFLLIMFILQLFVPTLAQGAIIGLAAKSYNKEEVKGGLILALYNFFPLLEIHGLFVLSNATTVFTICSMLLRYLEPGPIKVISMIVVVILGLIATLFYFLSGFAEEGVVIKKMGVFEAIGRSTKLIISHLSHIMFLLVLLFVISIRIVINAILVLIIPALGIGLGLLLTIFLPPLLSYSIGALAAFIGLLFASYFLAYLHVFRQTVWTLTFLELDKQKDLDVIGDL
jgi:hypothetical protein